MQGNTAPRSSIETVRQSGSERVNTLTPWYQLNSWCSAIIQYIPGQAQKLFISAITRVGNWNEDLFLAAEIEKDFERRKANGELKHQKLEKI